MTGYLMENQAKRKSLRLKQGIIVLSVLLILSAGGLTARYLYLHFHSIAQTSAAVPDNRIGERESPEAGTEPSSAPSEGGVSGVSSSPVVRAASQTEGLPGAKAVTMELFQGRPEANQKFTAHNLLPGDRVTQYYCVKTYHNSDLTLLFHAQVTEETKDFSEALHLKVTQAETGKVLCDAPFSQVRDREFSQLLERNAQGETVSCYQVEVSLDSSVGNEYQQAELKADFTWFVKENSGLTPPKTGDTASVALSVMVALCSFLLILLLLLKRGKGDDRHE